MEGRIKISEKLQQLFFAYCGETVSNSQKLPSSGSERQYYRLHSANHTVMGVYHPNQQENIAFLSFSRSFTEAGMSVPQILGVDEKSDMYLLNDLGDTLLFDLVEPGTPFTNQLLNLYKKALTDLVDFQVRAGKNIDFSVCYPRPAFDKQSMQWDLNYFKYNYLKLAGIPFDEQKLEDDFTTLMDLLMQAGQDYFMYRDFQSRNIMVRGQNLHYIDYQGGRKGPLQYDVASLLFQVRTDIPFETRAVLLEHYLDELSKTETVDKARFRAFYYGFVLLRLLQVMGAYGFRGIHERKGHFLKSIPYAVKNLVWWLENISLPVELPEINKIIQSLEKKYAGGEITKRNILEISINSFSYKKGYPADPSGNGGGFVFDCRALPNPGREEKYKTLSGLDQPVIDYLTNEAAMNRFLDDVFRLVDASVEKYLERGFSHLQVDFGCTGGQHRSVFSAESLRKHLTETYGVAVQLQHTNQEHWPGKHQK